MIYFDITSFIKTSKISVVHQLFWQQSFEPTCSRECLWPCWSFYLSPYRLSAEGLERAQRESADVWMSLITLLSSQTCWVWNASFRVGIVSYHNFACSIAAVNRKTKVVIE